MTDICVKVLKNGLLIDGTGKTPARDAVVVVKGNKIEAVGKMDDVEIPENAEIYDVKGKAILPGMIDLHGHLCHWYSMPDRDNYDEAQFSLLAAWCLKQSLEKGITTYRDAGSSFKAAFAIKRAQERGLFVGSRARVCGPMISMTGGHCTRMHMDPTVEMALEADGPWECRKAVRGLIKAGADHIKVSTTHRPWHNEDEFTLEELQAIMEEAHKARKKVMIHAGLETGMKKAIKAGVDSLEHGPTEFAYEVDDETIKLIIDSGVWLVPTLWPFLREETPEDVERKKARAKQTPRTKETEANEKWWKDIKKYAPINLKKCYDAGLRKIATGTDTMSNYDRTFGRANEEMILMVDCGIPSMFAIQAGTLNAAKVLGEEKELGSIEEGKLADIIVVDGDPSKDIKDIMNVCFVMLDGEVQKNNL